MIASKPDNDYAQSIPITKLEQITKSLERIVNRYEQRVDDFGKDYLNMLRQAVIAVNRIINDADHYTDTEILSATDLRNYPELWKAMENDNGGHYTILSMRIPHSEIELSNKLRRCEEIYDIGRKYGEEGKSRAFDRSLHAEFFKLLFEIMNRIKATGSDDLLIPSPNTINAIYEFRVSHQSSHDVLLVHWMERETKRVNTTHLKLIHITDNPNLRELEPSVINATGRIWFYTPRVYFSAGVAIHAQFDVNQIASGVIYEAINPPSYGYIDPEFAEKRNEIYLMAYHITSIFVETDRPIRILKIDESEWKYNAKGERHN